MKLERGPVSGSCSLTKPASLRTLTHRTSNTCMAHRLSAVWNVSVHRRAVSISNQHAHHMSPTLGWTLSFHSTKLAKRENFWEIHRFSWNCGKFKLILSSFGCEINLNTHESPQIHRTLVNTCINTRFLRALKTLTQCSGFWCNRTNTHLLCSGRAVSDGRACLVTLYHTHITKLVKIRKSGFAVTKNRFCKASLHGWCWKALR